MFRCMQPYFSHFMLQVGNTDVSCHSPRFAVSHFCRCGTWDESKMAHLMEFSDVWSTFTLGLHRLPALCPWALG